MSHLNEQSVKGKETKSSQYHSENLQNLTILVLFEPITSDSYFNIGAQPL